MGCLIEIAVLVIAFFIWPPAAFILAVIMMIASGFSSGFSSTDDGYDGYDEDCPYCGSGDTDGNHCNDCGEDF